MVTTAAKWPADPVARHAGRDWTRLRARAAGWAGRLLLAVMDQGLISGSNFVIGILLARWMGPAQYGSYALAFSMFLLLSQFHSALLLEPMSVLGAAAYRHCPREYLRALLGLHAALGGAILLALAAAAGVTHMSGAAEGLAGALAGAAMAAPCMLLLMVARRSFYLEMAPARSALGAGFYCLFVLGGLALLGRQGWLTGFRAFALMGAGGLLASALLLWRARPAHGLREAGADLRGVWRRHWEYGRWALASAALVWMPSNIYLPLLGGFGGMASAGAMKALTNLALPVGQTATALSLLFQTHASRLYQERGAHRMPGFARRITLLYAGGAALYWALVAACGGRVLSLLYGARYAGLAGLLPWLALASMLQISIAGPSMGLRAMEAPEAVFAAYGASGAVAVLAGVPLTRVFGAGGAVGSMIAASLAGLAASYALLCRRAARETARKPAAAGTQAPAGTQAAGANL